MLRASATGTYKGFVLEKKVDRSKGGAVQLVARCELRAWWDKEKKEWDDDIEVAHETAFLVLKSKDGKINKNQVDSIMRAFGWDGKSLKELHQMDVSKREVTFTVKEALDQNNNPKADENGVPLYSVEWINPVGGLKPVKAEDLDDMDKEWKELTGIGAPVEPAKDDNGPW